MENRILKDPFILRYYNLIKKYEDENKAYAYHGLNHALNVKKISQTILRELGYDENIINDAKIAALLHDIGCFMGKEKHEIRSYYIALKYIEENNLELSDKNSVLEAIRNHRNDFSSDNIITRVLVLSDKLDIKKERVGPGGYEAKGMRQMQYIDNIIIKVIDGHLIIEFKLSSKADLSELTEFYFMDKVYKSVKSFAEYNSLLYTIKFNDYIWKESNKNERSGEKVLGKTRKRI